MKNALFLLFSKEKSKRSRILASNEQPRGAAARTHVRAIGPSGANRGPTGGHRRPRKATGGQGYGRAREGTGGHGRLQDATGDHGRPREAPREATGATGDHRKLREGDHWDKGGYRPTEGHGRPREATGGHGRPREALGR